MLKRFLRIHLLTVFSLIAVLGAAFAWIRLQVTRYDNQFYLCQQLKQDADAGFEWLDGPGWLGLLLPQERVRDIHTVGFLERMPRSALLQRLDVFPRLRSITFQACDVSDDAARAIVARAPHLEYVLLAECRISPAALKLFQECARLRDLDLGATATDEHIVAINALHSVEVLDLTDCEVTDDGIGTLAHGSLRTLILANVPVTSRGLKQLSHVPSLIEIDLDFTRDAAHGLAEWEHLGRIQSLSLDGCDLSAQSVEAIGHATQLRELYLRRATLGGVSLEPLQGLRHLEVIDLRGTRIGDDDLATLCSIESLREIGIEDTMITDDGLRHLFRAKNLRVLRWTRSQFTHEAIRELTDARPYLSIK